MKGLVVAILLMLSGCASPDATPIQEVVDDLDPEVAEGLTINDTVDAPTWQVGDWFGHHLYFGPDDATGFHINVIVDEVADGYHLVTDNAEVARYEVTFDVPIVGDLSKDLDTTAFGGGWEIYDFPMGHGSTWDGVVTLDPESRQQFDVTYTASFREDFRTTSGDKPGFEIIGIDSEGRRLVKTDYVPAIGWYTEFITYNVATEAEDDEYLRAISMGTGHDWTGTYYEYDGSMIVNDFGYVAPDPQNTPNPAHVEEFQVEQSATHLMWVQFCFAVAGHSESRLVDPAGNTYDCQAFSAPNGADPNAWPGAGQGDLYELEDPAAGAWRIARTHAGFVAGGGFQVWSLIESTGQM